jgi:hypothetical protein
MKTRVLTVGVLCLLCGLLIGRMAPQADLLRVRTQLAEAKAGPGKRSASESAVLGVRSMLNVSDQDVEKTRRIKRARELMSNEVERADTLIVASGTNDLSSTNAAVVIRNDSSSLSNNIANLKKGWEMRTELARNNFIKKTELDTNTVTRFDVVIEAMNLRLGAAVDAWSVKLLEQGAVNEESGVRMMNELSEIMVLTYDEMDRSMPEGWREKIGPKFDLVRFVDPEVLTPLQDLEDLEDHTSDEDEEFE